MQSHQGAPVELGEGRGSSGSDRAPVGLPVVNGKPLQATKWERDPQTGELKRPERPKIPAVEATTVSEQPRGVDDGISPAMARKIAARHEDLKQILTLHQEGKKSGRSR